MIDKDFLKIAKEKLISQLEQSMTNIDYTKYQEISGVIEKYIETEMPAATMSLQGIHDFKCQVLDEILKIKLKEKNSTINVSINEDTVIVINKENIQRQKRLSIDFNCVPQNKNSSISTTNPLIEGLGSLFRTFIMNHQEDIIQLSDPRTNFLKSISENDSKEEEINRLKELVDELNCKLDKKNKEMDDLKVVYENKLKEANSEIEKLKLDLVQIRAPVDIKKTKNDDIGTNKRDKKDSKESVKVVENSKVKSKENVPENESVVKSVAQKSTTRGLKNPSKLVETIAETKNAVAPVRMDSPVVKPLVSRTRKAKPNPATEIDDSSKPAKKTEPVKDADVVQTAAEAKATRGRKKAK